ncbi:MAG: DUF1501 domain-containing protein, partial [Planctomycetota bacterium]
MTHPLVEHCLQINRRHFFGRGMSAVGVAALGSMLSNDAVAKDATGRTAPSLAQNNGPGYGPGNVGPTHFPATAKRVIYLCQSGAPSQIDTFDYNPQLEKLDGQELPDSIRGGQRLTGMTSGQKSFPAAQSIQAIPAHPISPTADCNQTCRSGW